MAPRTCVSPEGYFVVGTHAPGFEADNFRSNAFVCPLGKTTEGKTVDNRVNFPDGPVREPGADRIYEIANPFPFRGTTFINSAWADIHANRPETIQVPVRTVCSLSQSLDQWAGKQEMDPEKKAALIKALPRPLTLALAQASTDPGELALLAQNTCQILMDEDTNQPLGIAYRERADGKAVPVVHDHELYDILGNNPFLPDAYKEVMVLRPGIQGNSEIIGEYTRDTHVFEYLRRNSYIPWGHFAANMANDAVRYRAGDLTGNDMKGIRHLYYQRTFARLAAQLDIPLPATSRPLTETELESLRQDITRSMARDDARALFFDRALWGWNFGFGFAQSGHRLHASHQMIHQQNAMVPRAITDNQGNPYDCFSCGDLVADFIQAFQKAHGRPFFEAYLAAIRANQRTDGNTAGPSSLVVLEDDFVILFAPKAQVSEWELQLMPKTACAHILETDTALRNSLDQAMLKAVQILESLGAQMITSVEFSGRLNRTGTGQHLVYSFIPRLPYAPGTFSEAQLRWISGCYPEDFAQACRRALEKLSEAP